VDVHTGPVVARRLLHIAGPCALSVALLTAGIAVSGCGESEPAGASAQAKPAAPAYEALPTRKSKPQAIEPVAGETAATAALPTEKATDQAASKPTGASAALPRSTRGKSSGTGPTSDKAISDAQVVKEGIALPPIEAPQAVHDIIEAGNSIARTPYLWGGGHGKWLDKGYDCSGSISYALASAGLLNAPQASGPLMSWGKPGPGKWVTIYASPTHVYMVVAGVRFDTSGTRVTGSRWQSSLRTNVGFEARHPAGL
jgi:cell wall-associated NlpC family hydrolase